MSQTICRTFDGELRVVEKRYEKGSLMTESAESSNIDKISKQLDKDGEEVQKVNDTQPAKECGDSALMAFLNSAQQDASRREDEMRLKQNPAVKRNILAAQSNACRDACVNHMIGSLYVKSLPFDAGDKAATEDELRNDMKKYVADKGGAVRYVKDACVRESGRIRQNPGVRLLQRVLEAAEEEVTNFNAQMGIGFSAKTTDDIKFTLDDDIKQRLDNVTDEVDFDDITQAISKNVTNAAVEEIQRSKEEEAAKKALEDEIRNDERITTEEQVQEFVNSKQALKRSDPSLFESILIGKTHAVMESVSDGSALNLDSAFADAIAEYTKLEFEEAFGITNRSKLDTKRLASSYRV